MSFKVYHRVIKNDKPTREQIGGEYDDYGAAVKFGKMAAQAGKVGVHIEQTSVKDGKKQRQILREFGASNAPKKDKRGFVIS